MATQYLYVVNDLVNLPAKIINLTDRINVCFEITDVLLSVVYDGVQTITITFSNALSPARITKLDNLVKINIELFDSFSSNISRTMVSNRVPVAKSDILAGYFPGFTVVTSGSVVYYCVSNTVNNAVWTTINIPNGPTGPTGPTGATGASGIINGNVFAYSNQQQVLPSNNIYTKILFNRLPVIDNTTWQAITGVTGTTAISGMRCLTTGLYDINFGIYTKCPVGLAYNNNSANLSVGLKIDSVEVKGSISSVDIPNGPSRYDLNSNTQVFINSGQILEVGWACSSAGVTLSSNVNIGFNPLNGRSAQLSIKRIS